MLLILHKINKLLTKTENYEGCYSKGFPGIGKYR